MEKSWVRHKMDVLISWVCRWVTDCALFGEFSCVMFHIICDETNNRMKKLRQCRCSKIFNNTTLFPHVITHSSEMMMSPQYDRQDYYFQLSFLFTANVLQSVPFTDTKLFPFPATETVLFPLPFTTTTLFPLPQPLQTATNPFLIAPNVD